MRIGVREHHRRVLDEHRIRQLRRGRKPLEGAAELDKPLFVAAVLLGCASEVDGLALQVRELAVDDARRDGLRQRDQHGGER